MPILNSVEQKWVHYLFILGIIGKGINALIEIITGIGLYFLQNEKIVHIVVLLTHGELSEDPGDPLAHFLLQSAEHLSVNNRLFGSLYLLSHGVIKFALIIALLKRKLWAYPLAIAVFGVFIIYQLYRFTHSHSPWLIVFSITDIVVMVTTWFEYQRVKSIASQNQKH